MEYRGEQTSSSSASLYLPPPTRSGRLFPTKGSYSAIRRLCMLPAGDPRSVIRHPPPPPLPGRRSRVSRRSNPRWDRWPSRSPDMAIPPPPLPRRCGAAHLRHPRGRRYPQWRGDDSPGDPTAICPHPIPWVWDRGACIQRIKKAPPCGIVRGGRDRVPQYHNGPGGVPRPMRRSRSDSYCSRSFHSTEMSDWGHAPPTGRGEQHTQIQPPLGRKTLWTQNPSIIHGEVIGCGRFLFERPTDEAPCAARGISRKRSGKFNNADGCHGRFMPRGAWPDVDVERAFPAGRQRPGRRMRQ